MSKSLRLVFLIAVLGLASAASFDSRYFSPHGGETDNAKRSSEGLLQLISAVTNNTISTKLRDLPVGKTIQIGDATNGLKFVKVGESQYLSVAPQCPDPVLTTTGAQKLFTYTGNYQSYTFYAGCEYQIELWGASGGTGGYTVSQSGGYGAYTAGSIFISKLTNSYLYLGGSGGNNWYSGTSGGGKTGAAGYNGGGTGGYDTVNLDTNGGGGGGATDIRLTSGTWNDANSLRSRIMVAAGGGGGAIDNGQSARNSINYGNALFNDRSYKHWNGATITLTVNQIAGNTFGVGANGKNGNEAAGGGGGGWYGGVYYDSSGNGNCGPGSGGSSYISGHTGCVAVTSTSSSSPKSGCTTGTTNQSCSVSPYGYTFTNTVMIDGAGYQWTNTKGNLKAMPNPNGGNYASGVGHTGNGYARITRIN